ncbi:hypothetical protein FA95DRAFT_1564413 [Auriscalpium vulgare]|uniref:Uncharacterized protein n=1 Tax=Auriscalpium vulgare TaxID=40419 RepID=A0ACB8REN8_9AGAM|nr:hypothetical protein FA95DRAFT_1564413 [Auriscalpium vulgare]
MNSDVPVAGLPPEILSLVFSILSSIYRPRRRQSKSSDKIKHELGWLKATHVCQRWRTIALRDPALWASNIALPSVLGHRWAAAFVARAQDLPLTVPWCDDVSSYNRGAPSSTPFIGANLARTCAITHLCMHPHRLRALCSPAPLLHTLGLFIYDKASHVPDGLFGGAAGLPALRRLSLLAWEPLPWTPLLLAQLVSVHVVLMKLVTGAELARMLAALGNMPALERLALQLVLQDTDGVPVTLLPALRHLTLAGNTEHVLPLLAHLALPAGVRLSCDVNWSEGADDTLPTLFTAMMTYAHAATISRVDIKLSATPAYERLAEVCAWCNGNTDGAPALTVLFSGWRNVQAVLKSLALTDLEVLAVGGGVPDAAWLDALGGAPRLRRVTVKGGAVPPFCGVFERAPGILPALSTLVVNVHAAALAETVLWKALPRCLAARARAGNVLKELEVVGCDEDEGRARALQEAIPGLAIQWGCDEEDDRNITDLDSSSEEEDEEDEDDASEDIFGSDVST